jgi:hypothetical protein
MRPAFPRLRAVRHQLEVAPTATMWMHLGDLTGEIEHYEHAWTLSKQHLARAKLKLGSNAMRLEQWEEARTHLSDALGARSHYAEAWYCRAVCSLKLDALDTALADMRKVITLDPTHYQAWSSLGGLFARQKMKREALYAFRQACALRSDNWQLWQHAALAALDVGLFEESIFSAGRSLSLNGPPAPQISSLISQAVAKDIKGTDGRCARRSCPRRASCLHVLTTAPTRSLSLSLFPTGTRVGSCPRRASCLPTARVPSRMSRCTGRRDCTSKSNAGQPRRCACPPPSPTLGCPPTLAPPHPHLSPSPLAMALLLLPPDTNPEDDDHLFVEEPTIAAETLIFARQSDSRGSPFLAAEAAEAAILRHLCRRPAASPRHVHTRAAFPPPPLPPSPPLSLTAPCVQVRECLAAQLGAYREHMGDWVSETKTLDVVSEVAAQLVEAKLASGDVAEYRSAKRIVEEMLHQASERLAASPGCENLRMLLATCNRHLDDD